jgi:hypothetical protein
MADIVKELRRASEERAYGAEGNDRLARLLNAAANEIVLLRENTQALKEAYEHSEWLRQRHGQVSAYGTYIDGVK